MERSWGSLVLFAVAGLLVATTWQPLLDLDTRFGAGPEAFTVSPRAGYGSSGARSCSRDFDVLAG